MAPKTQLFKYFRTAANTVYTFVDRHRTRVENETNPTDTALAQLYAHIQALPDSQHKRRLIKHFNRQNGYGEIDCCTFSDCLIQMGYKLEILAANAFYIVLATQLGFAQK